jgi:diamine N-acetyltransferase
VFTVQVLAGVALRPSRPTDLAAVHSAEADPGTRRWLGDISPRWHIELMADPAAEHLSIMQGGTTQGFVVLAGLADPNRSIELRRIVVFPDARGLGVGWAGLAAALDRAFDLHAGHRVWLDVKASNAVARGLYAAAGLVQVGELREAMREPDGSWCSLVVMAVLEREWRFRTPADDPSAARDRRLR